MPQAVMVSTGQLCGFFVYTKVDLIMTEYLMREVQEDAGKTICTEPPAEAEPGREWILEKDR
jgi:hypothetical protein